MRPPLPLLLAATLAVTGCHVVERAHQCGALAREVKVAQAELREDIIGDDPPASQLRKKARLYGQLSDRITKLHVQDEVVSRERLVFTQQLERLKEQLNEAAQAVDDRVAFEARSSAPQVAPAPALAPPTLAPPAKNPPPAIAAGPAQAPGKKPGNVVPAPGAAVPPPLLGQFPRRPPLNMDFTRRYLIAKRSAEAASRGVTASASNLQAACQ